MADFEHFQRITIAMRNGKKGIQQWNQWRAENKSITPDLSRAYLRAANLQWADLSKANLTGSDISWASCYSTTFDEADLREASFFFSNLVRAKLRGAKLQRANLRSTNFFRADLQNAIMRESDLTGAALVKSNLNDADLCGCRVYGISAWDLSLENTVQEDLIITAEDKPALTVDNLEVAQFIHLILENKKIRDVIDTIGKKGVLILGRFYKKRKAVLDALRAELRNKDLVPIIFDFKPSTNLDLTETVQLLANMSKFVIADITDAKSIPQELSHIIPFFPSVPVLPILLKEEPIYAMFEHWEQFDSVLPVFYYENKEHLIENLDMAILQPVNNWKNTKTRTKALEDKVRELEEELGKLRRPYP